MFKLFAIVGLFLATASTSFASGFNYLCNLDYSLDGWKTHHEINKIKLPLDTKNGITIMKNFRGDILTAYWQSVDTMDGKRRVLGKSLTLELKGKRGQTAASSLVERASAFTVLSLIVNTKESYNLNCFKN